MIRRLALLLLATCLTVAGTISDAAAEPSAPDRAVGTVTLKGDPADDLLGGQTITLATPEDPMTMIFRDGQLILRTRDWFLRLTAGTERALAVGRFSFHSTWPWTGPAPQFELSGNGISCSPAHGSFTINAIQWTADRLVRSVDLSFVQYCGSSIGATRGRYRVTNPPRLRLAATIDRTEAYANITDGSAYLEGNLTCNRRAVVAVYGEVDTVRAGSSNVGHFSTEVACAGAGTVLRWRARAIPDAGIAFTPGPADVSAQASSSDVAYGELMTFADVTTPVWLKKQVTPPFRSQR
ncbi:MAG: hypothetical protein U0Q21_07845 [Dermatophilaceae bacterium]